MQCSPITWSNPVDRLMLGPDLLKELELTVKQVQSNLKTDQDRQKSHVDLKRTQKEFQVGEHVFVNLKPRNISLNLGSSAKLAPMYCVGIVDHSKYWQDLEQLNFS